MKKRQYAEIVPYYPKQRVYGYNSQRWQIFETRTIPYHACRYQPRQTDEFVETGLYQTAIFSLNDCARLFTSPAHSMQ